MNDRIGIYTEHGAEFPRLTIHGNPYDKTLATILNFDASHFAVVGFGEPMDQDNIGELKEIIETAASTAVPPAPTAPTMPTVTNQKKDKGVIDGGNEDPSLLR